VIRRATVDDAAAVSALVNHAYEHWVPVVGGRPRPMDDDYSVRLAELEAWVDAGDDEIRGVIVLERGEEHLWVDNVAVDPESKGTGIGRTLLELALRRAGELGLSEVRFFTHELMAENRAIYTGLGWMEYEPDEPLADFFVYFRKPVSA
jgi:N-acetylglutamate synthase-like GNAT family acetyltransferase